MSHERMMPVDADLLKMWTLVDRKTIQLALPPLPLAGLAKPIVVLMDFDAGTIDAILERLTVLRSQMLPPLPRPGKRN
jgi:hypothetical protein